MEILKPFGFEPPYDIQSFLIYTLIILSLALFGCLHSLSLNPAYWIISNGNFTFDVGFCYIQPFFRINSGP